MMDYQKEREAFEKHASKFFTDSKEAFKTNGDQYLYDEVIWMWDCWIERAKAQAVPEGFVLVKMEDLELLRDSTLKIKYASLNNDSDRIFSDIEDIQLSVERLIELQEPAND